MGEYAGLVVFPQDVYDDTGMHLALEASAAMQTHQSAVAKGYHPTGVVSFSWHQINDEIAAAEFSRAMGYPCAGGDWVCRVIAQVAEEQALRRPPPAFPDQPHLPHSAN